VAADKLPALAGLARALQLARADDEYLAGLWRGSLLDDLLWTHRQVGFGRRAVPGRPQEYRAPSWSWAAVDGNVRWPYVTFDVNATGDRYKYFATVLHAKTVPKTDNPLGEVKGGQIVLRGPLKQAAHNRKTLVHMKIAATTEDERPVDLGLPILDCEDQLAAELELNDTIPNVWLLRIKGPVFLVLTPAEGEPGVQSFRRLGVLDAPRWAKRGWVSFEDTEWLGRCEEQVVTII